MLDSSTNWMAGWHTPSFLRSHFKIHCISLCMYVYFIFQPSSTHETYRFEYNMGDLRDSLLQSHLHQDSHQDFLLCSLRVEMSRTQIDWFCIASPIPRRAFAQKMANHLVTLSMATLYNRACTMYYKSRHQKGFEPSQITFYSNL